MSLLLLFGGGPAPVTFTGSETHTRHHIQTGTITLGGPTPTTDVDGTYVEVAFTNNPGTAQASMTWVDVTSYVLDGVQVRSGRSTELDTFQGGTASFVLANQTRRFDPEYASSPYAGNLVPLRPVRIRYVASLVSYPLFTGFVTGWPQSYDHPGQAKSRIDCIDGFRLLQAASFAEGYFTLNSATLGVLDQSRLGTGSAGIVSQLSGARISVLLDIGQWPTADRVIDVGNSTLDESQTSGSVLEAIQSAVDGEFGQFYIDPQGVALFEDRHHRITETRSTTSQATFGDGTGEIPYSDITYDYSDKLIANDVTRTSASGTVSGHASDSTSITRYLHHANSKSVPISNGNDLQALAQALLARYKDPQLRIETLTFNAVAPGTATHAALIGLRISDRVTVKRRPQNVGSAISQDLWVEGISVEHRTLNDWSWTLNLSPVDTSAYPYLILDDATLGRLDFNSLAA